MARGMVYNFHITDNRMEIRFFEYCCDGSKEFMVQEVINSVKNLRSRSSI